MELDQATLDLLTAMVEIVGGAHVLADDDMRAGYETDWTGRYTGRSLLVVRPAAIVLAATPRCDLPRRHERDAVDRRHRRSDRHQRLQRS